MPQLVALAALGEQPQPIVIGVAERLALEYVLGRGA